jgi:hypothetical protein
MDKDDINIWRFNLHTHEGAEKQKEVIEKTKKDFITKEYFIV